MKYHNRENICDICGISFEKATGNPRREYDKDGDWTGRWLCNNCYKRYDPNSSTNIQKSLRYRRIGDLDPNCTSAKGDLFEELTCRWRAVKNLNIENDNYHAPIDHSRDPELGIIQTKGSLLRKGYWGFDVKRDHNKEFDNMICYCTDKEMKNIERVYILPKEEVIQRTSITITKDPHTWPPWYEKYRIKDEDTIKKVNEIYIKIIKN